MNGKLKIYCDFLKINNFFLEKKPYKLYPIKITRPTITHPKEVKPLNIKNPFYHSVVEKFLKTIKNNPNIDYNLAYNKLSNVKFRELRKDNNCKGQYDGKTNTLYLRSDSKFSRETIFHELLHAITTFDGTLNYCGFHLGNGLVSVGNGLNEGYTAYINNKIFGSDKSYHILQLIMEKVSIIVGRDKVEKFYFSADLFSLINELEKYNNNTGEVVSFVLNMDYILGAIYDNNKEVLKESVREVEIFLQKLLYKKDDLEGISREELIDFLESSIDKLTFPDEDITVMTAEERLEIDIDDNNEYGKPLTKDFMVMIKVNKKMSK